MADINSLSKDFSLPIDVDNESVIISSAIQDKENLELFCKRLDYREFRKTEYKTIAFAINEVFTRKLEMNVDAILLYVTACPERSNITFEYLTEIVTNFKNVPKENLEEHITKLKTQSVKSNIVTTVFSSLYKDCMDTRTDISKLDKDVEYIKIIIRNGITSNKLEFKNTDELILEYEEAKKRSEEKRTTGYAILDKYIPMGFAAGQVTTISGLQSAGKSSMALSIMNNLGNKKIPTAQFAMEMPNMSIMHKLLAFGSRLPVNTVIQKVEHLNEDELIAYNEAIRMLRMKSIYLNDKPGVPLSYIRDQTMLLQDLLKTEYIVVVLDLFGKIKDLQGSDNFARDYEKELNIVQGMARETGVHMILVAQVNKAVAQRKWSRPAMGDLKNAGAFAEISDLMLGVHRPNYDPETAMKAKMGYRRTETDNQYIEEDPNKDLAEVIIMKQRMGENNLIINFKFDPQTTRFIPFDDEDQAILNAQKFLEEE
jgi:replicative DNA helicase